MADYSLRSEVLKTDLVKDIKYAKSLLFFNCYNADFTRMIYDSLEDLRKENKVYFDEAVRIIEADRARHKRLKQRITKFLSMGRCFFLTLTFTNEVLESTSPDTRRQYVRKTLKSLSKHFVANVDFGDKTEREHYHAVIVADYFYQDDWVYGFSKAIPIYYNTEDPIAIAKYIAKLTNHAVKESCKRNSIIYSRET